MPSCNMYNRNDTPHSTIYKNRYVKLLAISNNLIANKLFKRNLWSLSPNKLTNQDKTYTHLVSIQHKSTIMSLFKKEYAIIIWYT